MNLNNEPVSVTGAINSAIVATLGILLFAGVEPEVVGALSMAATAWVLVISLIVRGRVTPVDSPKLTPEQYARTEVQPNGP